MEEKIDGAMQRIEFSYHGVKVKRAGVVATVYLDGMEAIEINYGQRSAEFKNGFASLRDSPRLGPLVQRLQEAGYSDNLHPETSFGSGRHKKVKNG